MTTARPGLPLIFRVGAALIGGYAFVWGFTSLIVAGTLAVGGDYDEGLTLAYMLAFLVYVAVFLWSFASQHLARVWLSLAGGGAAMTAGAWWLAQGAGLPH